MSYPNVNVFIKKAKTANLIPIYKEISADFLTPLLAFKKIKGANSFLFESVEGGETIARYSFLGSDPSTIIYIKGSKITIKNNKKTAPKLKNQF